MVVNPLNRNCVLLDLMTDGNLDVIHDLRRNDQLDDRNLDVTKAGNRDHRMNGMGDLNLDGNHVNRNYAPRDLRTGVNLLNRSCVRHDLTMVVSLDVNRGRRMSGRLDDLRMNVTDDRKMGGNHVNRSCVRHDLKMDVNLDEMNLHGMLMDDLNMSCDRMSHDHLRCDHLMMHHHDKNQMGGKSLDVMNLDGKMMNRHVIHRMKVCPKTDDQKMI